MNIGFHNFLPWWRVTVILAPQGSKVKRLRDQASQEGRLVSACNGRKIRAVIVTDSNQVVLSAISTNTLLTRLTEERAVAARAGEVMPASVGTLLSQNMEHLPSSQDIS